MSGLEIFLLIVYILVGILIMLFVVGLILILKLNKTYINLKKIDDEGYLYYLDYVYDYDKKIIKFPINVLKDNGCTVFTTCDNNNNVVTLRNYDFFHKDKNGLENGLNIVFKLNKEGKYKSLNIADAFLLSETKLNYSKGSLDRKNNFLLAFIPYLTMDAINEKGLHASILYLDVKKNEKAVHQKDKNKEDVVITSLLRIIIDTCKDTEEAIETAKKYNMVSTLGHDYHLYVSDSKGNSIILEWRNNNLVVINTDVATNFYLDLNDGEDFYIKDVLKDKCIKIDNLKRKYNYGFGHGYSRFNKVIESLDKHRNNDGKTAMTYDEIVKLSKDVMQEYEDENTPSLTRYSAIYNNTTNELNVYVKRNYDICYTFKLE